MTVPSGYTAPTTELEAVNLLLRNIGQTGIVSLDSADTNPDSEQAYQALQETNREIQKRGYHWNRETEVLTPDEDGRILLGEDALNINQLYHPNTGNMRLVMRGNPKRLRDAAARTETFAAGTEVKVEVTRLRPWEDLDEDARWYIACRAARRFASIKTVSRGVAQLTAQDERDALLAFDQGTSEKEDHNMADSPAFRRARRRRR